LFTPQQAAVKGAVRRRYGQNKSPSITYPEDSNVFRRYRWWLFCYAYAAAELPDEASLNSSLTRGVHRRLPP